MGIFSRFTDIMNANINALLDRAEDPAKMARLMIQEMEETLVEVRASAVKSIAEKKHIERQLEALNKSADEWTQKAEFAIEKGREDLAKGALLAKRKLAEQANTLEAELVLVDEALAKFNADMSQLQNKLEEAKTKRKALEIRLKTAEKRVKVRKTLNDGRVDEAMARYQYLEKRIDELEADADAYDLGRANKKDDSLEQAFADLEAESGINDELAALKQKLAKKGSQTSGDKA